MLLAALRKTARSTENSEQIEQTNALSNPPTVTHSRGALTNIYSLNASSIDTAADFAAVRLICSWSDMIAAWFMLEFGIIDETTKIANGGSLDYKKTAWTRL